MNSEHQGDFIYPCINSTGKTGVRYYWSSTRDNGLFGISKVVFGSAGTIGNAVLDMKDDYATTEQSMAIRINSQREGEQIIVALESEKFNRFLKACRWSNFRIDYKMFKYFKKDFWKEFV